MSCLSISSAWILDLSPYLKVHSWLRKYPSEAFLKAPQHPPSSRIVTLYSLLLPVMTVVQELEVWKSSSGILTVQQPTRKSVNTSSQYRNIFQWMAQMVWLISTEHLGSLADTFVSPMLKPFMLSAFPNLCHILPWHQYSCEWQRSSTFYLLIGYGLP